MWSCRAAAAVRRERADGRRCAPARATLYIAECGMRNAEWNAECGMRNVEHGMRNVEHGMRNAECGTRNAECGMWNVERQRLSSIASTIGADETVADCACAGGGG